MPVAVVRGEKKLTLTLLVGAKETSFQEVQRLAMQLKASQMARKEAEEAEEEREAAARLGHAPSSAGAGVSGTSGTMETPGFELGSRVDTREARLHR